jgi:hypothetical protein
VALLDSVLATMDFGNYGFWFYAKDVDFNFAILITAGYP